MHRLVSPSLVLWCIFWTALPYAAHAQEAQCGPHDDMLKALSDGYHESVVAQATAGHGQIMVELTVSASGSWTLIGTSLNGISCIHAAGDNWTKTAEPPKPGQPS